MTTLLLAAHDGATLKDATLKALSAALTERGRAPLLAGLCAGLAVYGDFIHAVFFGVLALHLCWRCPR